MKIPACLKKFFYLLLIFFSTHAFAQEQAIGNVISDTIITAKIKSKIMIDRSHSIFKVNVTTINGIVNLSGKVNSDDDAAILIQLAQSMEGVKDVNIQELQIENSQQSLNDAVITAKVKGKLIREKLLGKDISANVNVETTNGVVYLSGTMDTDQEVKNTINLARSIKNVKQVESHIKVMGS